MNVLDAPLISETRRNYAIEHATIHILSERFPGRNMGGHSNPTGFFIVGNLPTEHVRDAAVEALSRLQNGERSLAIHPGCGTNYLVMALMTSLAAFFGMSGTKSNSERWDRLPAVVMFSIAGLIFGQRLGPALQKEITTDPVPGDLSIVDVYPVSATVHRVITKA